MKSCLIVDDSSVVRKVARRILEDMDFIVDEAEDGQEAFDKCRLEMPDAILLDWHMPIMGGLEFLKRLRAIPELEGTPVGVITGDYFLGESILLELGVLSAVVRYKPIRLEDLTALTSQLLGNASPRTPGPRP